jgi:hypothetical protein
VEFLNAPGLANHRVTVSRALWGQLTQALKLTQVAKYADPASAQVVAARLVCEEIPCVILGGTRNLIEALVLRVCLWLTPSLSRMLFSHPFGVC